MRRWCLLFLFSCSLGAAELPKIVVIGGPNLLWPQIVAEYQRRYPSQVAAWELTGAAESTQADLAFAYYPTPEELKGSLRLAAGQWLGFPSEFVADGWKRAIDQEASAKAAAYLDEGGMENGVRLLQYLFSLVHR